MNGPNKLECYITPGWKGLLETNNLGYWAHSQVTKKQRVVNTTEDNPIKHFTSVIMAVP